MGIFDLTALTGPLPARVLPFALQLSSGSMLLGALAASVVGILWASIKVLYRRRARPVTVESLRLVVPARPAR